MLELPLIVVLMLAGCLAGLALGNLTGIPAMMAVLAMLGGTLGTVLAYVIIAVTKRSLNEKNSRHNAAVPRRKIRETNKAAFRQRLASFVGKEESEVMSATPAPASNMPFWSIVKELCWTPAKSVERIRQLLLRIRKHSQAK